MRYKDKDDTVPFTVIPNDMYKKAADMDAKLNTRRVLAWLLKEVVSETKKKKGGEYEMPAEGFAPKTWIAKDLDVSTDTVEREIEELKGRKIITTVDGKWKKYKVIEEMKEKYYERKTTYIKVNQNTDEWILSRAPRKKRVAELV